VVVADAPLLFVARMFPTIMAGKGTATRGGVSRTAAMVLQANQTKTTEKLNEMKQKSQKKQRVPGKMTSLVLTAATGAIVGHDILTTAIRETCVLICASLKSTMTSSSVQISGRHASLRGIFTTLDIRKKVERTQALIEDVQFTTTGERYKSVEIHLQQICDSLTKIQHHLNAIDAEILRHDSLYFSSWRALRYWDDLEQLQVQMNIMEDRMRGLERCVVLLSGASRMKSQI
jgi:hypothetical protein